MYSLTESSLIDLYKYGASKVQNMSILVHWEFTEVNYVFKAHTAYILSIFQPPSPPVAGFPPSPSPSPICASSFALLSSSLAFLFPLKKSGK